MYHFGVYFKMTLFNEKNLFSNETFAGWAFYATHHLRAPSFDNFIITFVSQKISQSFDKKQNQKNQDSLMQPCNGTERSSQMW